MATPKKRLDFTPKKQLDSTPTGEVESEENSPPSSFSITRRKSLRKRPASDAVAAEEEKDTKIDIKKKKKKKSSSSSLVWNEEDELLVLKGIIDYRGKSGFEPKLNWEGFYNFIRDSLSVKVAKDQLLSKIRKLKRKFFVHLERMNGRNDPQFTRSSDSEAFGFSMMIWGDENDAAGFATVNKDKPEQSKSDEAMVKEYDEEVAYEKEELEITGKEIVIAEPIPEDDTHADELCGVNESEQVADAKPLDENEEMVTGENEGYEDGTHVDELCVVQETVKESEEVANGESLKENEEAKTEVNGKPHHEEVVVKKTPEKTALKEDNNDVDELCAVQDAFETMMSQGLSDYQKKLQLQNLMNLGDGKRRELSDEWKALCVEVAKLNMKKLRFSAKLAEAVTEG